MLGKELLNLESFFFGILQLIYFIFLSNSLKCLLSYEKCENTRDWSTLIKLMSNYCTYRNIFGKYLTKGFPLLLTNSAKESFIQEIIKTRRCHHRILSFFLTFPTFLESWIVGRLATSQTTCIQSFCTRWQGLFYPWRIKTFLQRYKLP